MGDVASSDRFYRVALLWSFVYPVLLYCCAFTAHCSLYRDDIGLQQHQKYAVGGFVSFQHHGDDDYSTHA